MTTQVIVALSAVALASCEEPPDEERYALVFVVESDPGVRVPRARVLIDGEPVGESDANGRVAKEIRGQSGQRLTI